MIVELALRNADPHVLILIDDWIRGNRRKAIFSLNDMHKDRGTIQCELTCWPDGNYVSATGYGEASGNAFLNAIQQAEKTIGKGWRQK